jgi:hypothetical protein
MKGLEDFGRAPFQAQRTARKNNLLSGCREFDVEHRSYSTNHQSQYTNRSVIVIKKIGKLEQNFQDERIGGFWLCSLPSAADCAKKQPVEWM